MSSLIEGYNYDVFISYRQKDNKHDGWVTEFVNNLTGELESTFKEEISVYFDINPHDGLLETHDVDESLKGKLKCLIFIPIISRTYCDPKAFAWEHEFKAFIEQASEDEFGLKVRLPSGNVTSRVLPIIIYDLDKQDIKLCESVIGGALRGVEFIYETQGVNRPLRSNEDHPQDNINKTYYRDQVNKVANTIKDVLNSLTAKEPSVEEAITEPSIVDENKSAKKPIKKKPREIPTVSLLYRLKNLADFSKRTWRIISLALLIVSVGAILLYINKKPPDKPELRYDIPLTDNLGSLGRKAMALSPDGENLVYCMNEELNLKQLTSDAPSQPISGASNSLSPFFSPDGTWIGFANLQEMKIMKIPLTGGNPIPLCDLEAGMNQANWYDNEIIYADGSKIYRIPDSGGTPELLYPLSQSENNPIYWAFNPGYDPILWNPQLLPDKKTLLFSQQSGDGEWSIMTWRLGSKESPVALVERGRDGRYLKSGHIAYTLNNLLYFCKFNSRTNRIVSEPQIIATNPIWEHYYIGLGPSQFDISENGIIVYYESQETNGYNLVWVDEAGEVSQPITTGVENYLYLAISSDAQYIATCIFDGEYFHIEKVNVKTGNSQLFVENAATPTWSADNSSIYYNPQEPSMHNQVLQKPLDLSTSPVLLFELDSIQGGIGLYGISSDGRYLAFDADFGAGWDIGYYDIISNKTEMLEYYNSPMGENCPAISPDGKWVAFSSGFSGQVAIYVAPFPGPGQPIRVTSPRTANDIFFPIWAPDMTALYYCTNNPDYELWRIDMQFSENDFSAEPAQSFFNGGNTFVRGLNLEIHPNGDRFLVRQIESVSEEAIESRIKVIVNWEQELEGN